MPLTLSKISAQNGKALEAMIITYRNLGYLVIERTTKTVKLERKEKFDVLKALFGPSLFGGGFIYLFKFLKKPPSTIVLIEIE